MLSSWPFAARNAPLRIEPSTPFVSLSAFSAIVNCFFASADFAHFFLISDWKPSRAEANFSSFKSCTALEYVLSSLPSWRMRYMYVSACGFRVEPGTLRSTSARNALRAPPYHLLETAFVLDRTGLAPACARPPRSHKPWLRLVRVRPHRRATDSRRSPGETPAVLRCSLFCPRASARRRQTAVDPRRVVVRFLQS